MNTCTYIETRITFLFCFDWTSFIYFTNWGR